MPTEGRTVGVVIEIDELIRGLMESVAVAREARGSLPLLTTGYLSAQRRGSSAAYWLGILSRAVHRS